MVSNAITYYFQYNPMLGGRNSPLTTRRSDRARFPGEELVVVTAPLLRTRMTKGYADPFGQVVSEVNGTKVKNLAHLVAADPGVQGRIPHVPVRRGLQRDAGLPPQGDARSDRAAHERERHSAPGKRRRAGGLERQGSENRLSGNGITPVCGWGTSAARPTRWFTCGITRATLEFGDGATVCHHERPEIGKDTATMTSIAICDLVLTYRKKRHRLRLEGHGPR